MQFRFYVTDALRVIGENTAYFAGEKGRYIQKRYAEIYNETWIPHEKEKEPDGDEIIERMKSKLANL